MKKINQLMEQYEKAVTEKMNGIKSDIQSEADKITQARKALVANIEEYQRTTMTAIKNLGIELEKNQKQFDNINVAYKEALLEENEDRIVEIEKEIRKLKVKEVRIQTKISALQAADNKESYKVQIKEILQKHQNLHDIVTDAFCKQSSLTKELLQHMEVLKKLEKNVDNMNLNIVDGNIRETIGLYESIYGVIDVADHSCGTDEEAKRRFILGNCRGLENTVAGKLLEEVVD